LEVSLSPLNSCADYFGEVTRVVASTEGATLDSAAADKKDQWWKQVKKESREEKLKAAEAELERRIRLVDEHIRSYNDRFLDIEDLLESRFESLQGVEDSVQKERKQLERRIKPAEALQVLSDERNDVLLKWLRVTLGMTKKALNHDDDSDEDDTSTSLSGEPGGVPFSLSDESSTSVAFDDSIAGGFYKEPQLAVSDMGVIYSDSSEANDDL
jgi:hypothetical protein